MANILLQRNSSQQSTNGNSLSSLINAARSQGPSNVLFDKMYNSNPNFKQFADSVKDMTPEQAFKEHGLDFSKFKNFKW